MANDWDIIGLPTGAPITPIETPFNALADSVGRAMTTLRRASVAQVTSHTNRDFVFPNPKQGDAVYCLQHQAFESFWTAYDADTNPLGLLTPGWTRGLGRPNARGISQNDDSGWLTLGLASGYTESSSANPPRARRIGGDIELAGFLTRTGGAATFSNLATQFRPARDIAYMAPVGNASNEFRTILLNTAGQIQINQGGTFTFLSLSGKFSLQNI